ncbi:MAG: mycofactocin biosynthesis chaperone MftB [Solirubrobacteraceae bacterium]|jgi:putative mycofactocin binding protein MftB
MQLTDTAADLDGPWQLDPQVALRPEAFGALAYHFGTRRLSFLKSRTLLEIVTSLRDHPSAREACRAAGVGDREQAQYDSALRTLAGTGMIVLRGRP